MNESVKNWIGIIGLSAMVAFSLSLWLIWLTAWEQGGMVTVSIDSFGEAWCELFFFPAAICLGVYGVWRYIATERHRKLYIDSI